MMILIHFHQSHYRDFKADYMQHVRDPCARLPVGVNVQPIAERADKLVHVKERLDIILVAVGPMKVDFLAVIGNGIPLGFGVAAPGDEVAVLVIAAEKSVEMVENGDFDRLTALFDATGCLLTRVQILLADRSTVVIFVQIALASMYSPKLSRTSLSASFNS